MITHAHTLHATSHHRLSMPSRKAVILRWIRKLHAWIGLAGAAFGLLFGVTGFLLNHRGMMKIESGKIMERKVQVDLVELPANPEALARHLAERFNVPMGRVKWLTKAARSGRMGDAPVKAAELWTVAFMGHAHFAQASYVPGNRTLELEQKDASFVQVLKRLHKGDGGQWGWILAADAFAGGLVFLTLSGMLLWTRLVGPKLLALALGIGGLGLLIVLTVLGW